MTTSASLRDTRLPTHASGTIPAVGFGTLIPDPVVTRQATSAALEAGFRHLDCAERYRNETAVGEAMQDAFKSGKLARRDLFVTTKLWNTNHRPERVKPAFDASRKRLQVDDVGTAVLRQRRDSPWNPLTGLNLRVWAIAAGFPTSSTISPHERRCPRSGRSQR